MIYKPSSLLKTKQPRPTMQQANPHRRTQGLASRTVVVPAHRTKARMKELRAVSPRVWASSPIDMLQPNTDVLTRYVSIHYVRQTDPEANRSKQVGRQGAPHRCNNLMPGAMPTGTLHQARWWPHHQAFLIDRSHETSLQCGCRPFGGCFDPIKPPGLFGAIELAVHEDGLGNGVTKIGCGKCHRYTKQGHYGPLNVGMGWQRARWGSCSLGVQTTMANRKGWPSRVSASRGGAHATLMEFRASGTSGGLRSALCGSLRRDRPRWDLRLRAGRIGIQGRHRHGGCPHTGGQLG